MTGAVLPAFVPIWALTGLGYLLSRFKVLGENADQALTKLAFNVAMPAVLFGTLIDTPFSAMVNRGLIALAAGTALVGLTAMALSRWVFRRKLAEWAITGTAACYANAGNLGIPVALQVIGDTTFIVTVLMFQALFLMPSLLTLLETDARREGGGRWKGLLLLPVRNPVIAASFLGVLVGTTGLRPPDLLLQPIHVLGAAGVGTALLVLGMSLNAGRALDLREPASGRRLETAMVVTFKIVVQPALTLAIGLLLGLPGPMLFAVVVCAALPTAQNVFIATSQYDIDSRFVRDCVLISTLLSMGSLSLVAWLLGNAVL